MRLLLRSFAITCTTWGPDPLWPSLFRGDLLENRHDRAHPCVGQWAHHELLLVRDVDLGDDAHETLDVVRVVGEDHDVGIVHRRDVSILRDDRPQDLHELRGRHVLSRDHLGHDGLPRLGQAVAAAAGLLDQGRVLHDVHHVADGIGAKAMHPQHGQQQLVHAILVEFDVRHHRDRALDARVDDERTFGDLRDLRDELSDILVPRVDLPRLRPRFGRRLVLLGDDGRRRQPATGDDAYHGDCAEDLHGRFLAKRRLHEEAALATLYLQAGGALGDDAVDLQPVLAHVADGPAVDGDDHVAGLEPRVGELRRVGEGADPIAARVSDGDTGCSPMAPRVCSGSSCRRSRYASTTVRTVSVCLS